MQSEMDVREAGLTVESGLAKQKGREDRGEQPWALCTRVEENVP